MKKIFRDVLVCCSLLLLASCAGSPGGKEVKGPMVPLSCIAVPPAGNMVDNDDTIVYEDAKSLEKGAAFVTSVLADQLGGNPKVRLVTQSQMMTIMPGISGGIHGSISMFGKEVNCDGVLLTTVRKFKQREGTELAVDSPASADLKMVLYHAPTQRVLWATEYREEQESFLSNILSYNKMQSRGFKWVTVEKLVEDGVAEKLGQCPYLQ